MQQICHSVGLVLVAIPVEGSLRFHFGAAGSQGMVKEQKESRLGETDVAKFPWDLQDNLWVDSSVSSVGEEHEV